MVANGFLAMTTNRTGAYHPCGRDSGRKRPHRKHYRRELPRLRPRKRTRDFLSSQQFADFVKVPPEFVRRLIRRGQIRLVRLWIELRIFEEDLYEYVRAPKRKHGTILTMIDGGRALNNPPQNKDAN